MFDTRTARCPSASTPAVRVKDGQQPYRSRIVQIGKKNAPTPRIIIEVSNGDLSADKTAKVFPAISSSMGPKFRILIAEDNAINQKVITLALRETGFEIDVVADGRTAIAAQRSKPYDLILMDLQMPGVDGCEATRQIRKLTGKQPVIVAVTADVMAGVREKCRAAGMDAYLAKPFTRNELLSVVLDVHQRLAAADAVVKAP